MKKFIKSKLFPVAILVVIVFSLFVFLYCKGFRITYAPDLENSWDAISACATWAGVIMSSVAIIVAGIVAWRQNEISRKQTDIADKQNKIALFEKRLEIYNLLLCCKSSALFLKELDETEDFLRQLFITFLDNPKKFHVVNRMEETLYLLNCCSKLQSARLLFSEEVGQYITKVWISLLYLVCADAEIILPKEYDVPKDYSENKQNYIKAVTDLDEKNVLRKIKEEIKIT